MRIFFSNINNDDDRGKKLLLRKNILSWMIVTLPDIRLSHGKSIDKFSHIRPQIDVSVELAFYLTTRITRNSEIDFRLRCHKYLSSSYWRRKVLHR